MTAHRLFLTVSCVNNDTVPPAPRWGTQFLTGVQTQNYYSQEFRPSIYVTNLDMAPDESTHQM